MNLSQYQAFIKTVEEGSLTKAAEALDYTQSGITHMLDALEKQCGVRLLTRSRAGIQLTSEGIELLPYFREILARQYLLEEKIRQLKGIQAGRIRIGTFTSVSSQWLPGMIRRFADRYPDIQFELLHGTNRQNEDWVRSGRVDLAFVRLPCADDLSAVGLAEDPIVAVFAENSRWACGQTFSLSQLKDIPYIALSEGVEDEITELFRQRRVSIRPRFTEKDDYAVIAMAEKDLGVSIMPQLDLEGTNRRVRAVPLHPYAGRKLGIAYHSRDSLSDAAGAFIECAIGWLTEHKSETREKDDQTA